MQSLNAIRHLEAIYGVPGLMPRNYGAVSGSCGIARKKIRAGILLIQGVEDERLGKILGWTAGLC